MQQGQGGDSKKKTQEHTQLDKVALNRRNDTLRSLPKMKMRLWW